MKKVTRPLLGFQSQPRSHLLSHPSLALLFYYPFSAFILTQIPLSEPTSSAPDLRCSFPGFQSQPRCRFLSHIGWPILCLHIHMVSISTEMPLPEPPFKKEK